MLSCPVKRGNNQEARVFPIIMVADFDRELPMCQEHFLVLAVGSMSCFDLI